MPVTLRNDHRYTGRKAKSKCSCSPQLARSDASRAKCKNSTTGKDEGRTHTQHCACVLCQSLCVALFLHLLCPTNMPKFPPFIASRAFQSARCTF